MNASRSIRGPILPLAVIVISLAAVLTVALGSTFVRAGDPGPSASPSMPPSASPSTPPSTPPSADPSTPPSAAPGDGSFEVPLDIATPHDVSVVIDDETDTLVDASSGRAGDGMSVRWLDYEITNQDDKTLRLTWVGLPVDDEVRMSISADDGTSRIHIVQAGPPPNTDAVGFDRVLVLVFDTAVDAADVEVTFETAN